MYCFYEYIRDVLLIERGVMQSAIKGNNTQNSPCSSKTNLYTPVPSPPGGLNDCSQLRGSETQRDGKTNAYLIRVPISATEWNKTTTYRMA